ncbi:MAG: hypothetical protein SGARI_000317 [Bacillariaceae sp.]
MKLIRSVLLVAASTLLASATPSVLVDAKATKQRRAKNLLKVTNDPLGFPMTIKSSMAADAQKGDGAMSAFVRRGLGYYGGDSGSVDSGSSGSDSSYSGSDSASASSSGSTSYSSSGSSSGSSSYSSSGSSSGSSSSSDFVDHCLAECELSGGISAGDRMVPPMSVADWKDNKDMYCCKGGASYLKIEFSAENGESGMLTFDADIAANNSTCPVIYGQAANIAKKHGPDFAPPSFSTEVRFVACDDECLLDPLAGIACDDTFDVMPVENGTQVCFAVVDTTTNHVLFDEKMDTNLIIYGIPYGDEDPGALMSVIHTSCSKPLVPPFAVGFHDPCGEFDEENGLLNLDYYFGSAPYLAFVDGISTGYYNSAMNSVGDGEDQDSYRNEFDISFASCGCTCDGWITVDPIEYPTCTPDDTESPVATPSASPSDSPVSSPSSSPSSSPLASPSASPSSSPLATPSASPSDSPVAAPSASPSSSPVASPSASPSPSPVAVPSASPIASPSASPSALRSAPPSTEKSAPPTQTPSAAPSAAPNATPSASPSDAPIVQRSAPPSMVTLSPSANPSGAPIMARSSMPSSAPSASFGGQPGPGFPTPPTGPCVSACADFVKEFCVFGDIAGDLVGGQCDVTQEITSIGVEGEDDGGEDDGDRRRLKFEYHLSRIAAIEHALAMLD